MIPAFCQHVCASLCKYALLGVARQLFAISGMIASKYSLPLSQKSHLFPLA